MNKILQQIKRKLRKKGVLKVLGYIILSFIDPLIRKVWKEPFLKTYSQKGEDIIIDKLLNNKKSGFYIDIGANDPDHLNNTKRFYNKGWHGINIEPNPILYYKLNKKRGRDINLNIGISDNNKTIPFYILEQDTLSTFSKRQVEDMKKEGIAVKKILMIKTHTLKYVLNKHVKTSKIDFMSIDTEGYDLIVLNTNDWEKFKPKILCIEATQFREKNKETKINNFLKVLGYKKYINTIHFGESLNSIFIQI